MFQLYVIHNNSYTISIVIFSNYVLLFLTICHLRSFKCVASHHPQIGLFTYLTSADTFTSPAQQDNVVRRATN